MTVDEFVQTRVDPKFWPVVAAIRSLMREAAPEAEEVISYGMPVYRLEKPIAWINAGKTGVTLGFREGRSFEDRHGLLRAASRHSMNVRIRNLGELNRAALEDYVAQAVKIDKS